MLMKKKSFKNIYSENNIIKKYLQKLNFDKAGTFNFKNDAAYINIPKNYKTVVSTDTITENIDFFSNDPPESIAQKIICTNLSDMSAMGSFPISYTLNLSINYRIDDVWLERFTKSLFKLQKKYKIYLIGGDLSKSTQISISSTFFGQAKLKNILSQNKSYLGDDIWVTGNLGNSYIGYKLLTKTKLKINKKQINKFKNYYLYPHPCMFGCIAYKYINSAIDISDGFYGDLNKMLDDKYGAKIIKKNIPITYNLKKILLANKSIIDFEDILKWGDDYELIFTAKTASRKKILSLSKKNHVKLSKIGTIVKNKGIHDDSSNLIKNISSYDHFL